MEGIVSIIIGGVLTLVNALILLTLNGIKNEIKDLWKRVYSHYHEIDCTNPDCKKIKTGNVVVPHEG
ncbi:MAG: hypothetical protein PHS93_10090 [Candidatus Omnitrophica bacterium]|nr:hypothetical protein [Candidatus Omnitrophota bacterium]